MESSSIADNFQQVNEAEAAAAKSFAETTITDVVMDDPEEPEVESHEIICWMPKYHRGSQKDLLQVRSRMMMIRIIRAIREKTNRFYSTSIVKASM
ncbi:hypothetical protein HN51_042684 [Arachis hypogaea]